MPHQCRCAICGEVGVISPPALINPFVPDGERAHRGIQQGAYCTDNDCGCHDPAQARYYTALIVPTETSTPYASSRADELAPRGFADIPTCAHGYARCMVCKFPAS